MASVSLLRLCSRKSYVGTLTSRRINSIVCRNASVVASRKVKEGEDFWKKNTRMDRPVSPHLTIYKFELPAILSVLHRGTGSALAGVTSAVALFAMATPENINHYLATIQSFDLPTPLLLTGKCLLAFPIFYHSINGVRHLVWDTGRGFKMTTLYKTGYFVVGISLLATAVGVSYAYAHL